MTRRKSHRIDVAALERARKALGTRTETETIHRALEMATNEARLARALRHLIAKGRGEIHAVRGGKHVVRLRHDRKRRSDP